MTPAELDALMVLCRKHGVSEIELEGAALKFFPPEMPDEPQKAPKRSDEMCECGHAVYEHGDGGCLRGCDPEKCEEKTK